MIRRTDDNQKDIVQKLRCIPDMSVFSTHIVGKGFPDIVVGYGGRNYLFEIKDGSKPKSAQKLTKAEELFHGLWEGQVNIVRNFDEIITIINKNHKNELQVL